MKKKGILPPPAPAIAREISNCISVVENPVAKLPTININNATVIDTFLPNISLNRPYNIWKLVVLKRYTVDTSCTTDPAWKAAVSVGMVVGTIVESKAETMRQRARLKKQVWERLVGLLCLAGGTEHSMVAVASSFRVAEPIVNDNTGFPGSRGWEDGQGYGEIFYIYSLHFIIQKFGYVHVVVAWRVTRWMTERMESWHEESGRAHRKKFKGPLGSVPTTAGIQKVEALVGEIPLATYSHLLALAGDAEGYF